jgi:hypothetical protein
MTTHMHTHPVPTHPTSPGHTRSDRRRARHDRPGPIRRWYGPLVERRTWKETASLVVALPLGAIWFTLAVTALSVSAALAVTVVGVPLLALVLRAARGGVGRVERASAAALLDTDVPPFPPRSTDGTWWERGRRSLRDGPSWKAVGYSLLSLPIGIVTFTATVVMWSVTAAAMAFPVYQAFLSDSDTADVPDAFASFLHGWGRVGGSAAVFVVGVILLAATPRVVHALANVQRAFVRGWLSPRTAPATVAPSGEGAVFS